MDFTYLYTFIVLSIIAATRLAFATATANQHELELGEQDEEDSKEKQQVINYNDEFYNDYRNHNHNNGMMNGGNDEEISSNEEDSSQQTSSSRALLSTKAEDVTFYLFNDPKHPQFHEQLHINRPSSVNSANFDIGKPIIFIIHGFLSKVKGDDTPCVHLKNAYLKMSFSNIICVDWSPLSTWEVPLQAEVHEHHPHPNLGFLLYFNVVEKGVPICGGQLAKMIRFLMKMKILTGPEQIHLLGVGLGSHCAGIAAYDINKKTGRLVDRISGLDPAGPFYKYIKSELKLTPGDATFVDALHTDIEQLGSPETVGDADFYVNGGKGLAQPSCMNFTLHNLGTVFSNAIGGLCSHTRSYHYYGRSILKKEPELIGCRCQSPAASVLPAVCASPMNVCQDKTLYGEYGSRDANGKYYVNVGQVLPGLGDIPLGEIGGLDGGGGGGGHGGHH